MVHIETQQTTVIIPAGHCLLVLGVFRVLKLASCLLGCHTLLHLHKYLCQSVSFWSICQYFSVFSIFIRQYLSLCFFHLTIFVTLLFSFNNICFFTCQYFPARFLFNLSIFDCQFFRSARASWNTSVRLLVRPQEKNGSLICRHICLMNHQTTP